MTKSTGIKAVPLCDLEPEPLLKLDFGCGKNPRPGFDGVDAIDFGQKHVFDVRNPWVWEDASVEEVFSSHFIEHLDGSERVHFFNELHRVLIPGGKATIVAPHWSNDCAYGDPTHKWPPVSNWMHLYLNKAWRDGNAPHVGYTCDFDAVVGFNSDQMVSARNHEYQQFAVNHYRNGARDIFINLVKK